MKIRVQIVENAVQFFCHPGVLTRDDFSGETIERAVMESVRDQGWIVCRDGVIRDVDSAAEGWWIVLNEAGTDAWEYAEITR